MTPYKHVYKTVSALGIPGTLMAWPIADGSGKGGAPAPPFFVYLRDEDGGFSADDGTYAEVPTFMVELYEAEPDLELEARVAQALRDAYGPVRTDESWVDSEHVRLVSYTFPFTPKTE